MKRVLALVVICMCCSGCGTILSDINGWDLSACSGGGFDVCAELFFDNSDKIYGEFEGF